MLKQRNDRPARAGWRLVALSVLLLVAGGPAVAEVGACPDPLSAEATAVSSLALERPEIDAIRDFYRSRDNRCAWSAEREAALDRALALAPEQGLDADRYHLDDLRRFNGPEGGRDGTLGDLVATAMAMRYARDVMVGRVDLAAIDGDVGIPRPAVDIPRRLAEAIDGGTFGRWLSDLEPADAAYGRLVSALQSYREMAQRGGWLAIPSGPTLEAGRSDPRVETLKQRLRVEGDLASASSGGVFDRDTGLALQSFQSRHGLAPDGRLGPATLAALNVPPAQRVDQILANLERWRILARALPASGITVNAAAATAVLTENRHVVLSMRAIVGDRRHPTPMLLSHLDAIILNPPWIVPRSIIRHEIEPALRRDPDYLARNQMRWIGDQLVQSPGPKNSLGQIKFEFPNPFSVYMHETPARALFARDDRARSHGCVRLERPRDLAAELLKDDPAWSRDRLVGIIADGGTVTIPLRTRIPVVLAYWTAFVDEDGTVEFRDDLYGRDARLLDALGRKGSAGATPSVAEIGCRAA